MNQENKMTHEEKIEKWNNRNAREVFHQKTPYEEIPIKFHYGSSSHKPDQKVQMKTADIVLWMKFLDGDWLHPYGRFSQEQIRKMIEICHNDQQVERLMELLSATKE